MHYKNNKNKMGKLSLFFTCMILQNTVTHQYDAMLYVLRTFFVRRHVRTVTVDTCWPYDVDARLARGLSSDDISVSFDPSARQTYVTWYRHGFLVDLSCKNSTDAFRQISNDRLFNTQNDWVLFNVPCSFVNETDSSLFALQTFQKYLADAYVLPDSGVFLFQEIDVDRWEIWTGFRASKSDKIRVFKIATMSPNYYKTSDSVDEKLDFRGITLKSSTVIVDSNHFFGFNTKISSDIDVFAHMHYEIIETLSHQLNFKMDLSFNNDYGWSMGNGSFSGLTGLLQKETIDFSATGVLIRPDRMTVIDYTVGIVALRTTALFRQPLLSSVHNIQLLPFAFDVWLVISVMIFVFIVVLFLFTTVNNYSIEKKKITPNVEDIITLVHGALCQQGLSLPLNLGSIRVVVFVLFFTTLFVYTSYSASIAALIQSNSNSIKSIRDIVESPMTFSAQISPYGKFYFEETDDTELKRLYKNKILPSKNQGFTKATEGIEKIRSEFHGFLVELISAYKIIGKEWREEEKCGLSEIELFKIPLLSIALVKKSGHRDVFKQKLIQQIEVGLSKRINNQWIPPKPSCGSSSRAKQYVSVSIREIHLTLTVFGYGVCISLAIFTLEVIHHAWINRQSGNKS